MICVQYADLRRAQSQQNQWSVLDWWPPVGWWPDSARDLLCADACAVNATFLLAPRPESVHSARSFATGSLAGWGLGDLADSMELVVSELATNALRHGLALDAPRQPEPIRMSLVRRGTLVACAFTDPGSAVPVRRDPAALEPGGLGLHIVESLSLRWGWNPIAPRGKVVWAVLTG